MRRAAPRRGGRPLAASPSPTLLSVKPADIIVVGGGVVGLYAALTFLRSPSRPSVTLLEADKAPAGVGAAAGMARATGAGQGYLWLAHRNPAPSPLWSLAAASRSLWADDVAAGAWEGAELAARGSLLLAPHASGAAECAAKAAALVEAGIYADALDASSTANLEPALTRLPPGGGALRVSSDAQIDGRGACDALLAACVAEGGSRFSLYCGRPVAAISYDGDRRAVGAELADGSVAAAAVAVVLATGAWTSSLLGPEWAAVFAPRKGHLVDLPLPLGAPRLLSHGAMEADYAGHYGGEVSGCDGAFARGDAAARAGVVFTAARAGRGGARRLLIGSSRDDAAGFDPSIDPSAVALILERARLFLPALPDASAATVRVGLRPACAAGVPAVGAVPGAEGLFVAAGHEGSGLLLAPATARLLVRAVLKEEGGGRDAAIHAAADAVSPRRVLEAVEKRRKEETV
jgi:glycine/D-amino acid oxidase-like deaminating enzyme